MKHRTWRALTGALLIGGAVAFWVGTVFDGAGATFEFGPWAILWGGIAALVGLGLGAGGRWGRGVLALVSAVVAGLAWWVIIVWGVRPLTLEGAWLYPIAGLATVSAVLAVLSLGRTTDRA